MKFLGSHEEYDHVCIYIYTSFWAETPPHPWELEVDSTWVSLRHDLLGDRLELRIWVRQTETG